MTREKFEEWAREALPHALLQWSESLGGYYLGIESNAAWAAWKAADRAAREECAGICEKRASVEYDAARANAALRCADRIRETMK
jgi:hypothetical protein